MGRARTELSETLRDTLAIVAYRQPVTRAQVETVRGVPCADSLRQLLDLGLIRMAGREATLGRPVIYRTSRKFLLWCGVRSLDDLPPLAGS
jgi:segregation and condensation protein B